GESPPLEEFATPGVLTIEALSAKPYGVTADQQLKTLVYVGDEKPVIAIVRGDDQLNEAKLQTASGASVLRPAHPDEIQRWKAARAAAARSPSEKRSRSATSSSSARATPRRWARGSSTRAARKRRS